MIVKGNLGEMMGIQRIRSNHVRGDRLPPAMLLKEAGASEDVGRIIAVGGIRIDVQSSINSLENSSGPGVVRGQGGPKEIDSGQFCSSFQRDNEITQ